MQRNRDHRPFYDEYAWAYDLIVDRPVGEECAVIDSWLTSRGVTQGGSLLDAGCGTGRYSFELARLGYRVHGVDASPALIQVAQRAFVKNRTSVSFSDCDLRKAKLGDYDAILCRGVLNDVISDGDRQVVFDRFAKALPPGGALVADVREWSASADRKGREPVFCKRVSTERGELTFTSLTELDIEQRQLRISERHVLDDGEHESVSECKFLMRCWTRDELESRLVSAGFSDMNFFGSYDPAVQAGATDRLVVVTQRSRNAA